MTPSLNALYAFATLAGCGSYSRAGERLNVTHAAVMQQVRALEAHFGLPLVVRSGRGVALSEDGERLARHLETGFRHIEAGIDALSGSEAARPVQVTMSPAFAVRWLMPRLADFQTRHPDVTLLLNPTGRNLDLKPGGMDLAIRYHRGDANLSGLDILTRVDLAVVGVPALVGSAATDTPADLMAFPWLEELGTTEVTDWLTRHGVAIDRPPAISQMPGNLILDAVRRGDGLTYTARQWVAEELARGELVELFPDTVPGLFHIVTGPGEIRRPVRTFIAWLRRHASTQGRAAGAA